MSYLVKVVPRSDRKARIAAEAKASSRNMSFKFRGKLRDLRLIQIPLDMALYRMKNGRTEGEQDFYLLNNTKLPTDFFSAGEENVSAQRVQHEILLEMAKIQTRPIYQVLEKTMQQEEPLLITTSGVILNGNRRVAAMRDLFDRDKSTFGTFQFIDAAVLPAEATERDLDEIEVTLQMAVETKLEYTWINERLKIRRLMEEHDLSAQEIAKLMNYPKASMVNRELQELVLVEDYLERYRKEPKKSYKLVEDGAQIFKEIAQRVGKKQGTQQELAKAIAFSIVKGSNQIEDRVYAYRESFGEYLEPLVERLVADLKIPVKPARPGKAPKTADDDPLGGLEAPTPPHVEELLRRLNDPKKAEDLTKRIVKIHDSIKHAHKEDDRRAQAMLDLKKVASILTDVDLDELDPKHYKETRTVIDGCAKQLDDLARRLKKLGRSAPAAKQSRASSH
jgi:hypothetical protein